MTIIINRERAHKVSANFEDHELWVERGDFQIVSGFTLQPQGFCRGDNCIPIPPNQEEIFIDSDCINLTAFAELTNSPLVSSNSKDEWFLDDSIDIRNNRLVSLDAPDFSLPDLSGMMHSLSDYAGKKILLVSWASW
ncbi:MAG: hypothetical protein QGD92_13565 [Gammaproteobacteria bacterium]|nr:hypothetical protein [Gammaproteobacteria bacterium]